MPLSINYVEKVVVCSKSIMMKSFSLLKTLPITGLKHSCLLKLYLRNYFLDNLITNSEAASGAFFQLKLDFV